MMYATGNNKPGRMVEGQTFTIGESPLIFLIRDSLFPCFYEVLRRNKVWIPVIKRFFANGIRVFTLPALIPSENENPSKFYAMRIFVFLQSRFWRRGASNASCGMMVGLLWQKMGAPQRSSSIHYWSQRRGRRFWQNVDIKLNVGGLKVLMMIWDSLRMTGIGGNNTMISYLDNLYVLCRIKWILFPSIVNSAFEAHSTAYN